jgi:hypothetical protein
VSFQVPTFNLTCRIINLSTGLTRLDSACNLAWGRRVNVASTGGTGSAGVLQTCMILLLPALTDIRPALPADPTAPEGAVTLNDLVEVPKGSSRMYQVLSVDDIGKGFANEHRAAVIQMISTPFPMP